MENVRKWVFKFSLLIAAMLLFSEIAYAQQEPVKMAALQIDEETDPYQSRLFRVRGTPQVLVNTISGDIHVVKNSSINGVQVDLYVERGFSLWSGTRSLDNYRIIMQQQGDKIIASVEDRRSGTSRQRSDVQFYFQVQVPDNAVTELRTVNGSITLEDVQGKHFLQNQNGDLIVKGVSGDVQAASTTGNIYLEKLKGNIFAKTVSGNIGIEENSGEVRVRSISGAIHATGMNGTLVSATTSGNITTDFKQVGKGIYLESVSGDIQLTIPVQNGYEIRGQAMRFDLAGIHQSSISEQSQNFRERKIVIRDGGLPVQLSTVSGQIRISENQ
jgi:sRNA-binding regulator protein Hfq